MDFFLEIHNGECSLGGHFCDQQCFLILSRMCFNMEVRSQKSEVRSQEEEINQGESTLLTRHYS